MENSVLEQLKKYLEDVRQKANNDIISAQNKGLDNLVCLARGQYFALGMVENKIKQLQEVMVDE